MPNPFKRLADFAACAVALGPSWGDRWAIFWRLTTNIRVRLKLASHHPERRYALRTIYGPLHFRDNFGDVTNLVNLVWPNVYRAGRLPPSSDGVILDAGANIGLAAALVAHFNPDRTIYCFEPLRDNAAQIAHNCPTARVFPVALGAARDRVTLQVDPDSVIASSIPTAWDTAPQTFDVLPLDEFVRDQGIDRVALLKIDTEGMELDILDGARETLARTGRIAMETHGRDRHDGVLARLRQAGFRIDDEQFGTTTGLLYASRPVS